MPRIARLLGALLLALPLLAHAQSRTLNWPRISVSAHLDSTGTLHVRETQHLLLSGSWNGPERSFGIRRGQELDFHRLLRIAGDATSPDTIVLQEGDLDDVDRYGFANGSTLRWRSRLPGDPLFDSTALTYVLEYSMSGILRPEDERTYVLDHDFAFADRNAAIDSLDLTLTLHPAWRAPAEFTGRYTATDIRPGRGFVVTLPLTWTRADSRPASVFVGAGLLTRHPLALIALLVAAVLAIWLITREHALGRFKPLVPADAIDEEWLAEHVFHQLPEVIGATWDDSTAAPEVAATLARLVAERKLGSRVETKGAGIFKSHVLHLELEAERDVFRGHERLLIDALFDPGTRTTNTERVHERYKKTGFDPARLIRDQLTKRVASFDGVHRRAQGAKPKKKPSWQPTFVMALAAAALLVAGALLHVPDLTVIIIGVAMATFLYAQAMVQAYFWQRRMKGLAAHSLRFALPLALMLLLLVMVLAGVPFPVSGPVHAGGLTFAGLTLLVIAFVNSVLNQAKSRQSPARIALRKKLAAAREYFRLELRNESPALRDAWFPYLIAFGLGSHIDRWFRAFGAEGARPSAALAGGGAHSGGSSSGGSGWTGFGGGGGFAGGGSSASFAAAVGGIAGSVAAPSSGGSGGGGGGGSSGGGGGGGW